MEVLRYRTREEAKKAASALLEHGLSKASHPTLFLASGGSSLELLEGLHVGDHVTVSVLDERYSTNPSINTFSQLMNRINPSKYIDTRMQEGETLLRLALRFEKGLRDWKTKNPSGRILITQGMGPDGHTAGIFPYPEDSAFFQDTFEKQEKWVAGYVAKGKHKFEERVTVTLPFLRNQVDHSVFYVLGENKHEALERVLAKQGTLAQTPARIVQEMKNVRLFTDITKQ